MTDRQRPLTPRPKALWHPVPVSEIAIAIGLVAGAVGLARGQDRSAALPLVYGFVLIGLGVLELIAREHLSGFRRHTALLAFLIAAGMHGALVMLLPFRLIGTGALALDLVVFGGACGLLDAAWRIRTAAALAVEPIAGDQPDA